MLLPERVVHVWPLRIAAGDENVGLFYSVLAEDERARAKRFAFDNLRRSFILTRGVLRVLLGDYVGMAPGSVPFTYGAHGKPNVAVTTRVRFNISHSGDFAVFAFAGGCEVGVDVERIRPFPDMENIAARFFCEGETSELAGVPANDRLQAFFRCWTRKEAYVKAIGDGLSTPLDSFAVTLKPGDDARLISVGHGGRPTDEGALHNLELGGGYAGALVYRDTKRQLQMMQVRDAGEYAVNICLHETRKPNGLEK